MIGKSGARAISYGGELAVDIAEVVGDHHSHQQRATSLDGRMNLDYRTRIGAFTKTNIALLVLDNEK